MRVIQSAVVLGLATVAGTALAGTALAGTALAATGPEESAGKSLGFYVGAEFGSGKSSTYIPTWLGSVPVDNSATGWSVFTGLRPNRYFGAELSYTDFGTLHRDNLDAGMGSVIYKAEASNSAYGGYAVGYLPLIPNRWDLFAKVGYAGLVTKTNSLGNYVNVYLAGSAAPIGTASFSSRQQGSGFAFGFGAQYRIGALGVRAQYQRVSVSDASPSLVSLGAFWNF
jgi:hypothetical protein